MREVVSGGDDRVIQCRATAGFHMLESTLQLFDIRSKFLVQVVFIVEIDYEDLVVRIAGLHQVQGGFVDSVPFLAHRAGIVDDDADGDGKIFQMEVRYLLWLVVLENGEIRLVEIVHQVVTVIDNCRVQRDLTRFGAENKATIFSACWSLALVGPLVRGCGTGLVGRLSSSRSLTWSRGLICRLFSGSRRLRRRGLRSLGSG